MKKLWIVVTVLLLAFSFAMAQEVHWADQKTAGWDIVTTYVEGDSIPSEYLPVSYRAWIADWNGSVRVEGTETMIGETTVLEFTYTIPDGVSDPGIQSVVYFGGYVATSTIEWGSEQPVPFLFGKARDPAAPGNFRVQ